MTVPVAGRGPQVLAVYGFFTALATLTIILRAYCRIAIAKAFGWDDGLAIVAWIFFVCYAAFAITGVHHGTGQHAWNIHPASQIPVGLKFWWLCEPVYVLSNMAIKASIALMLLRLTIKPVHRFVIYITLVTTELYSAGFFLLFVFQCRPSAYFWTRYTNGEGSCIKPSITVDGVYAYSAITCVGDWIYAILPCILVWNLQMRKTQKFFVALILAMGAIASAATVARIPYVHQLTDQADFLYATTDVAIWSCCETGLGITAASCATLRPLFRIWFMPSAFRTRGTSSRDHGRTENIGHQHSSNAWEGGRIKAGYRVNVSGGGNKRQGGSSIEDMELDATQKVRVFTERHASTSSLVSEGPIYAKEFPEA